MYDDAQNKFKDMKEEDRFFFKIVKAKKRNQKIESKPKIFDVEKSNKEEEQTDNKKERKSQSVDSKEENKSQKSSNSDQQSPPKKKLKLDYSFAKKIFGIVKKKKDPEPKKEEKVLTI